MDAYCRKHLAYGIENFYSKFRKLKKEKKESIENWFSDSWSENQISEIEKNVYHEMGYKEILSSEKKYHRYFYYSGTTKNLKQYGIYQMYLFCNYFKSLCAKQESKQTLENIFNIALCNDEIKLDLTYKIINELETALEVVCMNFIKLNEKRWGEESKKEFKKEVDNIQIKIIAFLDAYLEKQAKNEGGIQKALNFVTEETEETVEKVLREYQREAYQKMLIKIDEYALTTEKDKYTILGTAFMHTSRYYDKKGDNDTDKPGSEKNRNRQRAKSIASKYRSWRIKGIKKNYSGEKKIERKDIGILKEICKFINCQNEELRQSIQRVLCKYVNDENLVEKYRKKR